MTDPKPTPDFRFEEQAHAQGYLRVAGVDEVGRGPLAGPVTAAAVILDPDHIPDGLNDSKLLSPKKRTLLLRQLLEHADVSVAHASVQEIDTHNILRASHIAMCRAIQGLSTPPDLALIDGKMVPDGLNIPAQTLVKGDMRSVSIAAASIAAKIARDEIMQQLAKDFPGYGWDKNAGYPTPAHKAALAELGVTPHHRHSFKPVHNILYQE
jgi:ribonuclease HII